MAKEDTKDKKVHKFFELVPPGTNFKFVENRWRFIGLSIVLIVLSLASLVYNQVTSGSPLNMGIDFAGGSQIQLAFAEDQPVDIERVRGALDELGYEGSSAVEVPDRANEVLVRIKETISIDDATLQTCEAAVESVGDATLLDFTHPEGGSKLFLQFDIEPNYREVGRLLGAAGCQGAADKGAGVGMQIPSAGDGAEPREAFPVEVALVGIGAKVRDDLETKLGAGSIVDIVGAESVGSKVGDQLQTDGIKSMLFAIGFIFLYVMLRFDLRFAPGGIVALCHDAFLVVGAFALTGKEFNLQTIAAILTVIGYSINDTIVVFDRVRERVALHRDEPIEITTNAALNDTLSRTLLTSVTTLMVVAATYVLGSGPIKDFSFALIVGLLVGTYSSLYIATPVFLWVNRRFYAGRGHLQWAEQREGTGTLLGKEEIETKAKAARADEAGGDDDGDGPAVEVDGEEVAAAAEQALAGVRKTSRRRRRRRPEGGAEGGDGDE
ncbi:protein translocase subunit SecF [Paraliomyxa miuraensis]|uniref:protein translocase subunit SecF n=1 Tax=Paraliomyxa miuraensis TaxID=376150 RepID=UPI002250A94A|nr:protein translocase subunit SecF [Paraliomyxa miuraensis]MCX4244638.1 protein translocase subunit SecF [Paraliomyxa miuraensis]